MYSQNDLANEIHELIATTVNNDQVVAAGWIAQAIFNKRQDITGGDADFYKAKAWDAVRADVRQALNRYKSKPEEDQQLVLPGYRYLQKAYMVERNQEQAVVPISQMTDEEIIARVAEYQRMADGCMKHAEELMGYLSRRQIRGAA